MALALWRLNLQPASFNGVPFQVDVDTKVSGRRIVQHEFPKQDTPYAEDMGRRQRRFTVRAYIVSGPVQADYQAARDELVAALETEGAGLLIHPTLGTDNVVVDTYSLVESRDRGGIAEFEIAFIEAGQAIYTTPATDTQGVVSSTAQSATQSFQQSSDIIST